MDDKALDSFARSAAHPIYVKGLAWDGPWEDAKIGPHGYVARVRRGHGMSVVAKETPRAAVGVAVEIPNRKTIRLLGSWNDPSPEVEQEFFDLVRGLGRCVHKPKRGCVPVQPVGDEDEVESAPKKAPGSKPFG